MTPREKALETCRTCDHIDDGTCLECVSKAIREAIEECARVADEERRLSEMHCADCGKATCYNEASRYAARAAGAETIAAAILDLLKR